MTWTNVDGDAVCREELGGTTSDGYDVVRDGTRSGKNSFGDEFGDSRYDAVLFDLE